MILGRNIYRAIVNNMSDQNREVSVLFLLLPLNLEPWVGLKTGPLRSQLIAEFICHDGALACSGSQMQCWNCFPIARCMFLLPVCVKNVWHKNCLALGDAAVTFDHFSHLTTLCGGCYSYAVH